MEVWRGEASFNKTLVNLLVIPLARIDLCPVLLRVGDTDLFFQSKSAYSNYFRLIHR